MAVDFTNIQLIETNKIRQQINYFCIAQRTALGGIQIYDIWYGRRY